MKDSNRISWDNPQAKTMYPNWLQVEYAITRFKFRFVTDPVVAANKPNTGHLV